MNIGIVLNGDNMKNKNEKVKNNKQSKIIVEYGEKNLKDLISEYLEEKFIDFLKEK